MKHFIQFMVTLSGLIVIIGFIVLCSLYPTISVGAIGILLLIVLVETLRTILFDPED